MEITLETFTEDGDTRHLETVDWPQVPNKKDVVVLHGPKYGKTKDDHRSTFTVASVIWEMNEEKRVFPTVHLKANFWDNGYLPFVPKCVCESSESEKEDPDRCAYCGDRVFPEDKIHHKP